MSNVFLGYQNRIDECTLTLGSWSAGLPRANLQSRQLSKVARTADDALASTLFLAAMTAQRPISVVALVRTNLSRAALFRVRIYTDAGLTDEQYDSGWTDAFALWTWAFGTIPWEDPHFWDGKPTEDDLDGYFPRDVIHVLDYRRLGKYVKVEINDTANADGYVEIGRAFIGDGWQPEYNMPYGSTGIQHADLSGVVAALGGAEFFAERDLVRTLRFELQYLSSAEAMQRVFDMQRISKTVNEVVVVFDPEDVPGAQRQAFLGRLQQLDAIRYPFVSKNASAFEIKEIL